MRRFFRSAAFPILIVIVLAFFAQRLISPPSNEETPTYNEFLAQIEKSPNAIDTVTFQQKTETVKVTETNGDEYSTGYPPDLQAGGRQHARPQATSRPRSRAPAARASSRSSPTSCRSSSSSASGSSS